MEQVVDYFARIPSSHRSLLLVGGITFFWIIESVYPLFKFQYHKTKHAGINIFFTITTILVNFPLAFLLVKTSDWAVNQHFGILNWLPQMPLWSFAIVGLLILDLIGAYFIHWLEHRVKWMWRFHLIHHSDTHVDTTTANRHHPGESVFRLVFTTLAAAICGAPMWLVFMYQSISVVLSQFNHSNIALPHWIEKSVGVILVTPGIHHSHHHFVLPHTDSNYGNIFSIWDRIFGTYLPMEASEIVYGVDTIADPKVNNQIGELLRVPFLKI